MRTYNLTIQRRVKSFSIVDKGKFIPLKNQLRFLSSMRFGLPLFLIVLLIFTSLYFEAQSIEAGYKLRITKSIFKNLRSRKVNLELVYVNIINPLRIRELAKAQGFVPPEQVYRLENYINQVSPHGKSPP